MLLFVCGFVLWLMKQTRPKSRDQDWKLRPKKTKTRANLFKTKTETSDINSKKLLHGKIIVTTLISSALYVLKSK